LALCAELTHDLIATLTGVPFGTVKGRVRLGLRRLRHALQDLAPSSLTTPPVQMQAA
jgi:DNA-directed RNA polymerase specialized sigma24 family protein